jgi:tetratricopeptide (TPR) repeat protein
MIGRRLDRRNRNAHKLESQLATTQTVVTLAKERKIDLSRTCYDCAFLNDGDHEPGSAIKMSERPTENLDGCDIDLARRIDAVCRRYEADWREGRPAAVDDYLGQIPDEGRAAALAELNALERELKPTELAEHLTAAIAGRTPSTVSEAPTIAPEPATVDTEARAAVPPLHEEPTRPPSDQATVDLTPYGSSVAGTNSPRNPRRFGDYEIVREIARGGMGVVFQARQLSLNRTVAVKMVLAGQLADERDIRRFYTEAEAAASLDHPGIVPIFEVGHNEGQHYFSMGFVDGQSLSQRLALGPLPHREAAALMVKVAEAIEYAHQREVIHRDLKPANILLDRHGNPRVTDFGLAKKVQCDSGLTGSGQIMGTPSYMPPEQAGGKRGEVGPASDVYALGATLYAVLTGRPPFQSATAMDTVIQVLSDEPVPPRRLNAAVPQDLETICLKCLEKEPQKRYPRAELLGADLRRFLAEEPIAARPVGGLERTWRWCRRNPWAAALAGTVAASLLTATVVAILVASQQSAHARAIRGKNTELTAANTALELERTRALEREKLAIDAVKRFGDAVSTNRVLKDNAALEPLRRELLKEPLSFFKTLRDQLDAARDTRPESLDRLARAAFDLAQLTAEIGDRQDALRAHKESLAIGERLARENPNVDQFQSQLAATYGTIGSLQIQTGDPDQALESYNNALVIQDRLARDNASVTEFQSELATSHNNIGALQSQTGHPDQALDSYAKALTIFERLARENPSVTKFQSRVAGSHNNIGFLQSQAGRPDQALESFGKALAIRERLARENPSANELQLSLAGTHANIGLLQRATGHPDQALQSCAKALAIQERLARENPSVTEFQSRLAQSYNNIGMLRSETGHPDQALESYAKALPIDERLAREHPESPDYASDLGGTLNNMALIDLDRKRFREARDRLRQAISWQKKALAASPRHPTYRQFLGNHLGNLIRAANGLGSDDEARAAQRELNELAADGRAKAAPD